MSDVIIKPAWLSPDPDTGQPRFGPDAWNAARMLSGGNAGDVVTRDTASATGASWLPARGTVLLAFDFSSTITPPPTSSQLRFNAATAATTTAIYVHGMTSDGIDAYWILMTVAIGSIVTIQDKNDHTLYAQFTTTGAVIDHSTYIEIPVAPTTSAGTLNNNQGVLVHVSAPTGTAAQTLTRLATLSDSLYLADTPVGTYHTIWMYTIPANTLKNDGDIIRVFVSGAFDGNVSNREVVVVVGTNSLGSMSLTGAASNTPWCHQSVVMRVGAMTKAGGVNSGSNGGPFSLNYSTDFTNAVSILVQGKQDAAPSSWPTIWVRQVVVTFEPI